MSDAAAPFYNDVALGPDNVVSRWLQTDDDVRIRVAAWPGDACKGTVLLFPGRTEFVEKYGMLAADFNAQGLAMLAIDWRGQGLADRLIDDPNVGHVGNFEDYQKDVRAALKMAHDLNLPKPWFLIGHSMGGCIGLRSLHENLPVAGAIFSAPMWGILLSPALRPAAWIMSWASKQVGADHVMAPGTKPVTYVLSAPFEDNTLTTDPEMYRIMQDQVRSYPELSLAGPSLRWLHEALMETRILAARPAPDVPCLTLLGSNERIVDPTRVHDCMATWPKGHLHVVDKGEHEVLMESDGMRREVMDACLAFFSKHSG